MNDPTRFALADAMELTGATLEEVWWRYTSIGGFADIALVAARIAGLAECDDGEHNLIAQALNECFMDQGLDTSPVAYAANVPSSPPARPQRPVPTVTTRARRRACEARLRSAAAARQAAALQVIAARLMQSSGQYAYAQHARARAAQARVRASAYLETI